MRIKFLTNSPSPYRVDFFNELGLATDLTVIFEAEKSKSNRSNKWYTNEIKNFKPIFLKKGKIENKKINWRIVKYLEKSQQDLIIVTNYAYLTELVGLIIIKLKKIPYALEVDGGIIRKESKVKNRLKKYLINNAKGYFSPSKETDEYLLHYGVDKKKIYRYPFTSIKDQDILKRINTKKEKEDIKDELNVTEEKMILSVGQFIHRKGMDVLLRSSKELSGNVGVYIIGGTPSEQYKNLVKDLELKNVHFIDFKEKEELKKYFQAADLFVLPTREDIWGLVINEAMSMGLPVITTDKCVAGIELIKNGENGFIIPSEDSVALTERINQVINCENTAIKMSKNSLEKIKKYTIENMVKAHQSAFQEIINK